MSTINELNRDITASAKMHIGMVQAAYSSGIFTMLSQDNWSRIVMDGVGHFISFPAFAGLGIARLGFYAYDLIKAKNKNLGKVASFTRELASVGIITTAVVGGFFASTALAALAPVLFVGAMGLNTLYNLGTGLHNAYRWASAKTPETRQQYKDSFKKHMIGAAIGAVTTVGVAMMMVAKVAVAAMAIATAAVNAVGFFAGVKGAIQARFASKKEQPRLAVEPKVAVKDKNNHYLYQKNRARLVMQKDNSKEYLLKQINNKIQKLKFEKERDKHSFFSQAGKRSAKIAGLAELQKVVSDETSDSKSFAMMLAKPEFNKKVNKGMFQSFFRKKSDTQDIFEAGETYFQQKTLLIN